MKKIFIILILIIFLYPVYSANSTSVLQNKEGQSLNINSEKQEKKLRRKIEKQTRKRHKLVKQQQKLKQKLDVQVKHLKQKQTELSEWQKKDLKTKNNTNLKQEVQK